MKCKLRLRGMAFVTPEVPDTGPGTLRTFTPISRNTILPIVSLRCYLYFWRRSRYEC